MSDDFNGILSCPVPIMNHKTIQLGHGSGGKMSRDLLEKLFLPRFGNETLNQLGDQARLELDGNRIAYSTDSFVVDPLFFPGGNIGDLAINGTVNDLAVGGAKPLYLSVGFIIEEGMPIDDLHRILLSMEVAAKKAGVSIVTGDTKVVNKGSVDKLFINTTGIGIYESDIEFAPQKIQTGDKVIVSGYVGDHGITILSSREGLALENPVETDSVALNGLVDTMMEATGNHIRVMRDPTRGGVATSLNEFADSGQVRIRMESGKIPVRPAVESACEILGLDPLYVANEGKLLAVVSPEAAPDLLKAMQNHEYGTHAAIIGEVIDGDDGRVSMMTGIGGETIIDMLPGEQLPRIC
ncbi:MAG: hydrogenase expression/formation protein HypE [Candidatus Marinimicrobia bacterium]|nr:hydrogenase expression/formation protein HypE [Candidatus Neomarinimicrobiota bacterium]MCF7828463.1 hydrogenase expression/formation protein HypE [Candidatus Neomarinimicrobiota bacterium]MCF7880943.1 hydrogenase expression/formation protein HypE [Candidatus Neomarinimicrobiota bacterium]